MHQAHPSKSTNTCTGSRRVTMSLTVGCTQASHLGSKLRPLCSQYNIAGVASPVIKLHVPPPPLPLQLVLAVDRSVVASTPPPLSSSSSSPRSPPRSRSVPFLWPEAFFPMWANTLLALLCSWLLNKLRRLRPQSSPLAALVEYFGAILWLRLPPPSSAHVVELILTIRWVITKVKRKTNKLILRTYIVAIEVHEFQVQMITFHYFWSTALAHQSRSILFYFYS